nr:DUF3857 domain-containing protein [uncultured Undibacterium sp.]
MRFLIILLASLLISSPTLVSAQASINKPSSVKKDNASFSRKPALPKWAQNLAEIPSTQSKEPVVMRLNETQAWAGNSPSVLINRVIQVNDQNAIGSIGQFGISYYPNYQQMNLHKVAILRGVQIIDRTATVSTRLLQRETAMESGMVGGATTVQLLLDDVRVGDSLWITYSIDGENPVFGNRWTSDFYWESGNLTELRRVTVLHPRNRPLIWRQLGDYIKDEIKPHIDVIGDVERIRFEARAIEAIDNEPSIPKSYLPVRVLQFSEYNDWQEVAAWADGLFPRVTKNAELKKLAQNFIGKADALAQASAALQWVQNEVRYFSVSIGENSHRPQSPATVLKRRYGDCKDKSYLLVSLLAELGIEARPVLLSAQSPKIPAKMQPTPAGFDHVIVQLTIGDQIYYVDPTRTNQTAMIDKLPAPFPEAAGLVVDLSTKELMVLPARNDKLVHYEHRENMQIVSFGGDAMLETREIYRGTYAEWARQRFPSYTKSEFRKAMLGIYEKLYPEISLEKEPSFQDYPEDNRFEIIARFKLINVLTLKDGKYSLDYDTQILQDTLGIPEKIIRNYPFELPVNRYHGRHYFNVTWPQTVREFESPSAKRLDNPFFKLQEELSVAGNAFHFVSDYQVKVKEVSVKDMPALQKQAKELAKYARGSFQVFEARLSKPGLSALTIRELEAARAIGQIEITSRKLQKIKEEDANVDEVCEMMLSAIPISELGGKLMARAAVEIEDLLPTDEKIGGLSLCRARLYFMLGQYDKSVELFEAEGKLATTNTALRDSAWANFYAGKPSIALQHIDRYFLEKSKYEDKAISALDLAYIIALYQRMGKALPPELVIAANDITDGPWPRPLLGLQLGQMTTEKMNAYIKQFSHDTQQLYLEDLRFFTGQKHLAEGRKNEAQEAFVWVKNEGTRNPSTYMQSIAELSRLTPAEKNYVSGLAALYRKNYKSAFNDFTTSARNGFAMANTELGRAYYLGYPGVASQDYRRAMEFFTLAANGGDAEAMNFIGTMYAGEKGVVGNPQLALEWYAKAAEKNDRNAYFNLAKRYLKGDQVAKDVTKAIDYYQRAALQDDEDAQFALAELYFYGGEVQVDYAQAFRWAFLASFQGNLDAAVLLGRMYSKGYGVAKNGKSALYWLEHAAKRKEKSAPYYIGRIYELGIDIPVDKKTAADWYQRGTDNGHADAMGALGMMYREGFGRTIDTSKAVELINKSATLGSQVGQVELAYMYQVGKVFKQDLVKANQYFRPAAQAGNTYAQKYLALNLQFGEGVTTNTKEAARWYQLAAAAGDAHSMNNLGDLYETGNGVTQDIEKAISLYEQAATEAYYGGFLSLASLYEQGLGLPKDFYLAYLNLKIAAKLEVESEEKDERIAALLQKLSQGLNQEQRDKAQELANEWKKGMPLPK